MSYYDSKLIKRTKDLKGCCWLFIVLLVAIALGALLSSCGSTKYVEVPVEHIVYVFKTDTMLKTDSVFCHDSVYVHSKGDTLLIEKWHTKYRDRIEYRVKTDSFIKVDSIAVPYPVEKKLSKWQQIKIDLGGWMVGFIILSIIVFCVYLARGKVFRGIK